MSTQETKSKWDAAQSWEESWHLDQQFNTFNEEKKQYIYASKMGLDTYKTDYYGQIGWDFGDRSVLDIGGGEVSMLLKSKASKRIIIDPLMDKLPKWARMRYKEAGISAFSYRGEDVAKINCSVDCVLIYNVLQHTDNPEVIIKEVRKICKEIRIFEWIDTPVNIGHIQTLTESNLNGWLGGEGRAENLNQEGAVGRCYYGIFIGDKYASSSN